MTFLIISLGVLAIGLGAAVIALGVRLSKSQSQLAETKAEHDTTKEKALKLEGELAVALTENEALSELDKHFESAAAKALKSNSDAFLAHVKRELKNEAELSKTQIDGLVKPIGESLNKVQQQVADIEKQRRSAYELLTIATGELASDTQDLREILKSSPARGQWGEQRLHNILEISGMKDHIDFVEQQGTGGVRPDAVVNIPGGLKVVIDAKAPFDAYYEAHKTNDEDAQRGHLERHAKAVMASAKELADRDYSEKVDGAVDFVAMFIPAEPILDAAMGVDPALWETAWTKHRVLLTTPGMLVAFLRTVATAWQHQNLQKNAQEIADEGSKLYNSLRVLTDHVVKLGSRLDASVDAYNAVIGSLERNVLSAARQLEKLGPGEGQEQVSDAEYIETSVREVVKPELLPPEEGAS